MLVQRDLGDLNDYGWTHKFSFNAFVEPVPGAVCFVVGEAWHPHRVMLEQRDDGDSSDMHKDGWAHKYKFYAFVAAPPIFEEEQQSSFGNMLTRFVVGEAGGGAAGDVHRAMMVKQPAHAPQRLVAAPLAGGGAGGPGHLLAPGPQADDGLLSDGWAHKFAFYACGKTGEDMHWGGMGGSGWACRVCGVLPMGFHGCGGGPDKEWPWAR